MSIPKHLMNKHRSQTVEDSLKRRMQKYSVPKHELKYCAIGDDGTIVADGVSLEEFCQLPGFIGLVAVPA